MVLLLAVLAGGCGGRTPLDPFDDGGVPGPGDDDDDDPVGDDDDDDDSMGDDDDDDDDDDDPPRDLRVSLANVEVVQDCMPVIPDDNVFFRATLQLRNGDAPIPELSLGAVRILDGPIEVASFAPVPGSIAPLASGERRDVELGKESPSLTPPTSCTLCGGGQPDTLRIELTEAGGGALAGEVEVSLVDLLECLG
jgi:hypothetical protein